MDYSDDLQRPLGSHGSTEARAGAATEGELSRGRGHGSIQFSVFVVQSKTRSGGLFYSQSDLTNHYFCYEAASSTHISPDLTRYARK